MIPNNIRSLSTCVTGCVFFLLASRLNNLREHDNMDFVSRVDGQGGQARGTGEGMGGLREEGMAGREKEEAGGEEDGRWEDTNSSETKKYMQVIVGGMIGRYDT